MEESRVKRIFRWVKKEYLSLILTSELKEYLKDPAELLFKSAEVAERLFESDKVKSKVGIECALLLGADVNAKNRDGQTVLIWAAKNECTEIVELLIQKGADVNAKDKENWTALMLVIRNGNMEITKLLIENNADVHAKTNGNWTALMLASRYGNTEITKLLIENGADVHARNNIGDTALIVASTRGHKEAVKILIKKGADINNARNMDGWTALIMTVREGHTKVAKLLIENGANVNTMDNYDETALIHAIRYGQTETAELLIQKGADVLYAYENDVAKTTINKLREEKPEIFTEKQKIMIDLYSNPENISPDKRKKVIEVLREFRKKGIIGKEESLELFSNLQKEWNKKILITVNEGMKRPQNKPDRNNLKRALR